MKRKINILQGQLQNFILFSLKEDKDKNLYWGSKSYRRDLDYVSKYEWGYNKEDTKILRSFLDDKKS